MRNIAVVIIIFINNGCLADHPEYFNISFSSSEKKITNPQNLKCLLSSRRERVWRPSVFICTYVIFISVDPILPGWIRSTDLLPKKF